MMVLGLIGIVGEGYADYEVQVHKNKVKKQRALLKEKANFKGNNTEFKPPKEGDKEDIEKNGNSENEKNQIVNNLDLESQPGSNRNLVNQNLVDDN